MEKMYKKYRKDARFYVIYIREAHPADGRRPVPGAPNQPTVFSERLEVASDCVKSMKLTLPFLIDDMKNSTEKAYSAWPDRMFVIGTDNKIAYRGLQGPRGFKPRDAEKALKKLIKGNKKNKRKEY